MFSAESYETAALNKISLTTILHGELHNIHGSIRKQLRMLLRRFLLLVTGITSLEEEEEWVLKAHTSILNEICEFESFLVQAIEDSFIQRFEQESFQGQI